MTKAARPCRRDKFALASSFLLLFSHLPTPVLLCELVTLPYATHFTTPSLSTQPRIFSLPPSTTYHSKIRSTPTLLSISNTVFQPFRLLSD
ncbi:hypothetical protein F5882DRAFT_138203 [Hyaloscypha sp. PMI_1271]|nr:hypothetical protein F5882DRAFT_138203 [Hyaloscypha sp. PMI_1271]